ncbi:MAG: hypothetical protein JNK60_17715 [Acidobacteria bacterium]|nr:hypothetical protein [Acidobacteriota bacterium]
MRRAWIRVLSAATILALLGVVAEQAGARAREVDRLRDESLAIASELERVPPEHRLEAVREETRRIELDLERLELIVPSDFEPAVERRDVEEAGARFGVHVLFSQARVAPEGSHRRCEYFVFLLGTEQGMSLLLSHLEKRARLRTWKREGGRTGAMWGTLTTFAKAARERQKADRPSAPESGPAEQVWLWPYTTEIRKLEEELRESRGKLAEKRDALLILSRFEVKKSELQSLVDFILTTKKPAAESGS